VASLDMNLRHASEITPKKFAKAIMAAIVVLSCVLGVSLLAGLGLTSAYHWFDM
jgi:hypothetical protein